MNDLKSKFVDVVVAVDEGRGFDTIKNRLCITAKFSGRIMESDLIPALANPLFNTELVWETKKKDLRKARADYASIRVDCYTVNDSDKRDNIGFIMLLLRTAFIVPSGKGIAAPFGWEKLKGVPDEYKKFAPTLKLSFALRDNFQPPPNVVLPVPPAIPTISDSTEVIPVTFTDKGFIKIGHSDERNIPLELRITVQLATNLELLLPEDLVFSKAPKRYFFSFTMFGMTVQTRTFYRSLHKPISLNETVVVSLSSSIEVLKTFFSQYSSIEMTFFNGTKQLGWTEIYLLNIINQIDKTNFVEQVGARIEIDEECVIRNKDGGLAPVSKDGLRKPTVDVHTVLEKIDIDRELGQGEHCANTSTEKEAQLEEDNSSNSTNTSDETNASDKTNKPTNKRSGSLVEVLPKIEEDNESYEFEPSEPILTLANDHIFTPPKCGFKKYCLSVILDSIIWVKPPKGSVHHIHFIHQKARSKLAFKTQIDVTLNRRHLLDNVHCQVLYISTYDRIQDTLANWSPEIIILDSNDSILTIPIKVDNGTIASESSRHHTYSTKVKNLSTDDTFAEVTLIVSLEELDLKTPVKTTNELPPIILDDFIAIKQLEDLEIWKAEQKQGYDNDMKLKLQEELTELRKSWTDRKNSLEVELRKNIARCKAISRDLKKSANSLEIDKVLSKNQDTSANNLNDEIQKNSIKYSICDNYELIETITVQNRDIILLKQLLNDAQLRVQELEKTALTGEQTRNLLQELRALEEKFETSQKAKDYFKEQWKKSAIEVHQLKIEDNRNVKKCIQSSMDELNLMTMQTYVYDTKNDHNIEWSTTLLKSTLLDEKVKLIESSNFDLDANDK